ncbi:Ubiquinone biosynthesis O-methyltransferase [Rosistilla ulvae]|uniref:Ubiquinone biosynthesis O-methyltransferase n=1 Tax=Rosistilla ulvae TaxID=1930277 RepID=A0A517M351_9BACT|nr:class I SAM-dependent methyltransferase [Rosistilla ulvae]QDS89301.1 Ubiquinone biosynthesis O-methyltransferase [Rosistilla ulvae]
MTIEEEATASTNDRETPFAFGRNWASFLANLNEERIEAAEESLRRLLRRDDLEECRFLDAGSGSGLFSLAAHRLGAAVVSFDVDSESRACTERVKSQYGDNAENWQVLSGSLLDQDFLDTLGQFDVVYCWGVAHHTGDMWTAIANLCRHVKPGGSLVLAIYNDQLYVSRTWLIVKRIYQRLPAFARPLYVCAIGSAAFANRFAVTLVACCLRLLTLRNPFVPLLNWARETQARGMHGWYDLVDWVGGWPFEVARPEEIFRFVRDRGFVLQEMTTSIGHGCNEFSFARDPEQ